MQDPLGRMPLSLTDRAQRVLARAWKSFRAHRDSALTAAFLDWQRHLIEEDDEGDLDEHSRPALPTFSCDEGVSCLPLREELLVKEAVVRLYLRDRRDTHQLFLQHAAAVRGARDSASQESTEGEGLLKAVNSFPPVSLRKSYDTVELEEVLASLRVQDVQNFTAGTGSPDASKCGDMESILDRTAASMCRSSIASAPSPTLYVDFAAMSDTASSVPVGGAATVPSFHPDGFRGGLEISSSFFMGLNGNVMYSQSQTDMPPSLEQIVKSSKAVSGSGETATSTGVSSQESGSTSTMSKLMEHVRRGGWTTSLAVFSTLRGRQNGIVSVRRLGSVSSGRHPAGGYAHGGAITTSMEISSAATVHFPPPVERSPTIRSAEESASGESAGGISSGQATHRQVPLPHHFHLSGGNTETLLSDSDAPPFPRSATMVSFEAPLAIVEKKRDSAAGPGVTAEAQRPPAATETTESVSTTGPDPRNVTAPDLKTEDAVHPGTAACGDVEEVAAPASESIKLLTALRAGASRRPQQSTHMDGFARRHAKIKPFSPASALAEAQPKRGGSPVLSATQANSPDRKNVVACDRPASSASRSSSPSNRPVSAVALLRQRITRQRQEMGSDPSLTELADQLAALRAASRMKIDRVNRLRRGDSVRPGSASCNSDIFENPSTQPIPVVTRALTQVSKGSRSDLVPPLLRSRRHLAPLVLAPPLLNVEENSSDVEALGGTDPNSDVVPVPTGHAFRKLRVHQLTPAAMAQLRKEGCFSKERAAVEPHSLVACRIEGSRNNPVQFSPAPNRNQPGNPPSRPLSTAAHSVDIFRIPTFSVTEIATDADLAYLKQLHATLF